MERLCAADVMTAPVVTARASDPIQVVARLLVARRISGVPVVDAAGRLVGIVTQGDLVRKAAGAGVPLLSRPTGTDVRCVGDVMSLYVITVSEDTPVREIAGIFTRNAINRVPVVHDGRPVGIVTRTDVLKVYGRSEDTLVRAARSCIEKDAGVSTASLDISVDHGVVSVRGHVPTGADVSLIATFVGEIDGVVAVDTSGLRYEVPA